MRLSVIIPNYNGEELLKKNLPKVIEALNQYKKGDCELIIPDDASKDNSVSFLRQFSQEHSTKHIAISVIANSVNKGFSGNVNSGVKIATGDILILLNSDVIPHKDFLEPLLKHFSDANIFAVGCMDESVEGKDIVLRGRGIGNWERGFLVHTMGSIDKSNTLWASGGSSVFRKVIWDKIGGLNELYNPFYWEDIDLSYKAQKAGYLVMFEPKSKVVHEHNKGAIKKNVTQKKVNKIAYRNQFFFVWLNITDTGYIFSHIIWLPYHIMTAALRKDTAFLIGLWLAIVKLPQVLSYRQKIRPLFQVSDKKIIARAK